MEALNDILQDPQWQIILGSSLALLILLFAVWFRRRRRSRPDQDPVARQWELITAYGQVFPSFLYIVNCYRQKHDLETLVGKPEVEEALSRLESLHESTATKRKNSSSILFFPVPASRSSQVKASLLTILRGIFDDEEVSRDLPPQALQEMDRFLDSLT